ncbi:Sensor histidine kinase YycG [uncultured Flavonifractor sp.]|nr:Sensor histidine kinase YycG [uncultured Flavonifractor sp.]
MRSLNFNPVSRVGVFLLTMVVLAAAFLSSLLTAANWDDLWTGGDYYNSNTARMDMYSDLNQVEQLVDLLLRERWSGDLSYLEEQQLSGLQDRLSPENTNFRYQVHDQSGALLATNLEGQSLEGSTGVQITSSITYSQGEDLSYQDSNSGSSLMVRTKDGYVACNPRFETIDSYNDYGYYSDGEDFTEYNSNFDTRIKREELVIQAGIANPMPITDSYSQSRVAYAQLQGRLPYVALVALITCLLSLAGIRSLLMDCCRRREDGSVPLTWQERVPYDVYLTADFFLAAALLSAGDQVTYVYNQGNTRLFVLVGLAVFAMVGAALTLGLMMTTAIRLKNHNLLRSMLVWRMLRAMVHGLSRMVHGWTISRRIVTLFLLYLLGSVLTGLTVVLIPVYQGFVLWCLCRWSRQWKAIRAGTAEIVGGNPETKIDTTGMYQDLREHAEQLNDLGAAVSAAVDQRMQSERFKAELITNVSHDLKTPLTSIINYVDLLKKEPLDNPKALEYLEVLDRKSQRLKKLTEDLVEASKASTGSLPVSLERLGIVQFVDQALGEYEERFQACHLTAVPTLPQDELFIWADGRHLWRVIDNLFSNCCKYALEGTRIYLDVTRWEGMVTLSVKNISRQQLNIPPERLMERFVRGEESRTTEGSGLGLSIARSLTELQGGTFRLDIDGDLFKAAVSFPEAVALPEPVPGLSSEPENGPDSLDHSA